MSEELQNKPALVVYMGMQKEATRFERRDYDMLAFFGQLGGFFELLSSMCMFLVYILC